VLLTTVGRWLDSDKNHRLVILDDIDVVGQHNALEAGLPGLVFSVRSRAGVVITTSRVQLTQRLRLAASIAEDCAYAMPPFDENGIDTYLLGLGLRDGALRQTWASIVQLRTRGHPQLVAARGLSLRKAGFPKPSANDILSTPIEIIEAQSEA